MFKLTLKEARELQSAYCNQLESAKRNVDALESVTYLLDQYIQLQEKSESKDSENV